MQDTEQQYVAGLYKVVCVSQDFFKWVSLLSKIYFRSINLIWKLIVLATCLERLHIFLRTLMQSMTNPKNSANLLNKLEKTLTKSLKLLFLLYCLNLVFKSSDIILIFYIFTQTIMLQLYPKYSKNKPTCDSYIKEFDQVIKKRQQELGDRLDLSSYLLTPIQRLGKYILILENIRKELKKLDEPSDHIAHALDIIKKQMKIGNDSIAIDSIKNCPINLLNYGSFLMREKFNVIKPRRIEAMLFMFQDIVVITHIIAVNT